MTRGPVSSGRDRVGADVAAHTFSFNDRVASQWGTGATVEAIPFVRLAGGAAFVEGRGGSQILLEDPSGNPIELFEPPRD